MKTLLSFLLLTSTCFAQLDFSIPTTVTKSQAVIGIEEPKIAGNMVITKSAKNLKVKEIALLDIKSEAAIINVKASDSKRNPVEVSKLERTQFAIVNDVDVWVQVTAIDFDKKIFVDETKVLKATTPPVPEPDKPEPDVPKPNPTVPTDQFDNIGQRVDALTKGLTNNRVISKLYSDLAKELRDTPVMTVTEANVKLKNGLLALPNFEADYGKVRDLINTDITKRWPMSKGVLADYWEAISKGFTSPATSQPTEQCQCNAGGTPCTCVNCNCGAK
jgi:hypothetical protein